MDCEINVRYRRLMLRLLDCLFEVRGVTHHGRKTVYLGSISTLLSRPRRRRESEEKLEEVNSKVGSCRHPLHQCFQTVPCRWTCNFTHILNSDHLLLLSVRRATLQQNTQGRHYSGERA